MVKQDKGNRERKNQKDGKRKRQKDKKESREKSEFVERVVHVSRNS